MCLSSTCTSSSVSLFNRFLLIGKSCENVSLHKMMHTCILSSFDNTVTENFFSLSKGFVISYVNILIKTRIISQNTDTAEGVYLCHNELQNSHTYTITWNDDTNLFLKEVMDGSSTSKTLLCLFYWISTLIDNLTKI